MFDSSMFLLLVLNLSILLNWNATLRLDQQARLKINIFLEKWMTSLHRNNLCPAKEEEICFYGAKINIQKNSYSCVQKKSFFLFVFCRNCGDWRCRKSPLAWPTAISACLHVDAFIHARRSARLPAWALPRTDKRPLPGHLAPVTTLVRGRALHRVLPAQP